MAAEKARVVAVARSALTLSTAYNPHTLDLRDTQAVSACVEAIKPDAIIHAAAVNPGIDDASMRLTNQAGTHALAEAAQRCSARLIVVSTDIVHNGRQAPYADDAPVTPINAYGESKALAEAAALSANDNTLVVRTSLIYGLDAIDRGTAGFAKQLAAGNQLRLFRDVMRQPVWRDSLAQGLIELALHHVSETGVMNLVGDELIDRASFGQQLLRYWGIDAPEHLVHCIDAASDTGLTRVPLNLELSLTRAHSLGLATPGFSTVLAQHSR